MNPAKTVAAVDVWSDPDGGWFAVAWDPDKPAPRGNREAPVGRSDSRIAAIAQAMRQPKLSYATSIDEEGVAVAAFRRRPMKLLALGQEVHFLGLR